jgi:hypothetical protein
VHQQQAGFRAVWQAELLEVPRARIDRPARLDQQRRPPLPALPQKQVVRRAHRRQRRLGQDRMLEGQFFRRCCGDVGAEVEKPLLDRAPYWNPPLPVGIMFLYGDFWQPAMSTACAA